MTDLIPSDARLLQVVDPTESRRLVALAHERIAVPARAAQLELSVIGTTATPSGPELVELGGRPWLLADAFADPMTRATGGRQVIPRAIQDRLLRLDAAGVAPDLLHIAHELPPGTTLEDVPALEPARAQRLRHTDRMLAARVKRAARAGATGVGIGLGVAVGVALSPLALLTLDPVLLGGVQSADGRAVAWVELARWDA